VKPTAIDWFRYESLAFGERTLRPAPLLQVVFEFDGRVQVAYGLVDSGSEISCLPSAIARALGCPLSVESEDVLVFGAVVSARKAVVDVRVATAAGVLSFRDVEFTVPVSEEGVHFAVLGRNPLFREVEVRFQEWLQRFGLQRRRAFLHGGGGPQGPLPIRASLTASRPIAPKSAGLAKIVAAPQTPSSARSRRRIRWRG
jgi:hypothetical protein